MKFFETSHDDETTYSCFCGWVISMVSSHHHQSPVVVFAIGGFDMVMLMMVYNLTNAGIYSIS